MKYKWSLVFMSLCAILAAIILVVFKLSGAYLSHAQASPDSICSHTIRHHQVVIVHGTATPNHTTAARCDTLTIRNEDNVIRVIAFGPHEHHVPYDGVAERALGLHQSLTITLVSIGNYRFHDHIHDSVQGTFTVTP